MSDHVYILEFPALLQVVVSAKPDGHFDFSDQAVVEIQDLVQTAMFETTAEAGSVRGMAVRVDGALVSAGRIGDQTTGFDRAFGVLNHLSRIVFHAEVDTDWQGRVRQTFPEELFQKLVFHGEAAMRILKEFGIDTDMNNWPGEEPDTDQT